MVLDHSGQGKTGKPGCVPHACNGGGTRAGRLLGAASLRALGALLALLGVLLVGCGQGGDVFPTEAGHTWLYRGHAVTMDGKFERIYPVRSTAPTQFREETVFPHVTINGRRYFYAVREDGIWRVARQWGPDKEVVPYLKPGLVVPSPEGASEWQGRTVTQVLEITGPPQETLFKVREVVPMRYAIAGRDVSVQTPAGNFSNCVRVDGKGHINTDVGNYIGQVSIDIETSDWYAPGVGLVKMERTERTSSEAIKYGYMVLTLASHRYDR